MRYGMAIDMKRCVGCHSCSVACKIENNLPDGIWWNRVLTSGGEIVDTPKGIFPNTNMSFISLGCQHCENPACVKACPIGATYKRTEDGIVIQDYDKCIGCRYCMVACPYEGVRQFNWEKPAYAIEETLGGVKVTPHQYNVVEKCTFCAHRVTEGEKPACISACPARSRFFGDLDDPNSEVNKAMQGRVVEKLLEEKGTDPSVFFLK